LKFGMTTLSMIRAILLWAALRGQIFGGT